MAATSPQLVDQLNDQPLNQAALDVLRRLKEPVGTSLHVLTLLSWGIDAGARPSDPDMQDPDQLDLLVLELKRRPKTAMAMLASEDPQALRESSDPQDAVANLLDTLLSELPLETPSE